MCYLFPGQCTDWVGLRSWQWWRGDHPGKSLVGREQMLRQTEAGGQVVPGRAGRVLAPKENQSEDLLQGPHLGELSHRLLGV